MSITFHFDFASAPVAVLFSQLTAVKSVTVQLKLLDHHPVDKGHKSSDKTHMGPVQ